MVQFVCDKCGHTCDQYTFGISFAIEWLKSNRTKLAFCKDFGNEHCNGTLHSGLTEAEVYEQFCIHGYEKYWYS